MKMMRLIRTVFFWPPFFVEKLIQANLTKMDAPEVVKQGSHQWLCCRLYGMDIVSTNKLTLILTLSVMLSKRNHLLTGMGTNKFRLSRWKRTQGSVQRCCRLRVEVIRAVRNFAPPERHDRIQAENEEITDCSRSLIPITLFAEFSGQVYFQPDARHTNLAASAQFQMARLTCRNRWNNYG